MLLRLKNMIGMVEDPIMEATFDQPVAITISKVTSWSGISG
jgi:hypothetical protein